MSISSIKSNDVRLNDNCVICTNTLKGGANEDQNDRDLMLVEKCKHVFHTTCLKRHMETPSDYTSGEKTCPMCRGNLSNVSVLHPNSSGDFEKVGQTAAHFLPMDAPDIDPSLFQTHVEMPMHLNQNIYQLLHGSQFQLDHVPLFSIPVGSGHLNPHPSIFAPIHHHVDVFDSFSGNLLNPPSIFVLPQLHHVAMGVFATFQELEQHTNQMLGDALLEMHSVADQLHFQMPIEPFEMEQNPFLNPVQDVSDFNFEIEVDNSGFPEIPPLEVDNSEFSDLPPLEDLPAFLQNMREAHWPHAHERIVVPPFEELSEQAERTVFSFFKGLSRLFDFVWIIISAPFRAVASALDRAIESVLE